jgi:xanthine dehydrogenase YagR molybdenum-binding subunit
MIGAGISRTDGPLKVSGLARYSAERQDAGKPLHAVVLGAAIAHGRITRIDASGAEAAPGVLLVLTMHNVPKQPPIVSKRDMFDANGQLVDDRILHFGQPVALVVADELEEARAAAALIEVAYEVEPAEFDLFAHPHEGKAKDESKIGDLEAAMAVAPVSVDVNYTTPYHFSQPMEPNACIADWRDDHLHIYLTAQILAELRDALATTLHLKESQVTVDSAFVGGGFGSKIGLHAEAVLASMASMRLGRPVKLAMTRRQVFNLVGHRAATTSRIRLGATKDGTLTALGHDSNTQTSPEDPWTENAAAVARALYAAPNRLTRQWLTTLPLGPAEPVRGPGEMPGLLAFESAVDELAVKLDMDPLELRLRNDTSIDPEKNRPLSGRQLAECLREGAERFGWHDRPKTPRSRRDGDWLVGYGVASSMRGHYMMKTGAKVRIDPEGFVLVQSDMTDLGMGTYTIVAQVAAQRLGVEVDQVRVELARTDFPRGWGAGGSWGSGNTSIATDMACQELLAEVRAVAGTSYNDLFAEVRRYFPQGLEATGHSTKGDDTPSYKENSIYTYGATYAEVGVDAYTGEVRVRRMLGVFSCGRILNAKTARSQLIGGMIWGLSAALHEGAYPDPRYGNWVNGDLAEYLVPVHADIPDVEAIALEDFDEAANHLGSKGIGELGAGGTGASVANAVFNACGVRVRDFPITMDKVLAGLPPL